MMIAIKRRNRVVNHTFVRLGKTRGIVSHDTLWAERDACFLLPGGRAGRLRHTTFVVLQGLLVVWLLAGCASAPPRMLSVRGCLETKPLKQNTLSHMQGKAKNGLTGQAASCHAFRDF